MDQGKTFSCILSKLLSILQSFEGIGATEELIKIHFGYFGRALVLLYVQGSAVTTLHLKVLGVFSRSDRSTVECLWPDRTGREEFVQKFLQLRPEILC